MIEERQYTMTQNGDMDAKDAAKDAAKEAYRSRTVGQELNARIASLKAEITRLEGVREELKSGASLLEMRIEDLRHAMKY